VDCTPLINIRSLRANANTNESLRNDISVSHTNSPVSRGGSVSSQNLQNRKNQNPILNPQPLGNLSLDGPIGNSMDSTRNNSPRQDDQNLLTNFNMDISPSASNSDNVNSMSDNPSPDTLNSASNTAFTPPNVDQSSMNGQSQNNINATKNTTNPNLMHFSPGIHGLVNQNDLSFSSVFDMTASNIPMDSIGLENPMALNEMWASSTAQPTSFDNSTFDMMDDTNNFADRQFDLLLRGMGWNGYDEPTSAQKRY
jgi:hypothetical protein